MIEFIKIRNELKTYFARLQDDGFFHPEDAIFTGIKQYDNKVLLFVRNKTVKSNLIEIEAPDLTQCLNFLKREIKCQ